MGSFSASVKDFAERSKEAQELILRDALEDVLDKAQTRAQSMARGAPGPTQGAIPVDTGHLAATTASDLNGGGNFSVDETGPTFDLTIAQMGAGDTAHFAWTAVYAMATNYGHGTYPGAHWVDLAAAHWPAAVAAAAERHKV